MHGRRDKEEPETEEGYTRGNDRKVVLLEHVKGSETRTAAETVLKVVKGSLWERRVRDLKNNKQRSSDFGKTW